MDSESVAAMVAGLVLAVVAACLLGAAYNATEAHAARVAEWRRCVAVSQLRDVDAKCGLYGQLGAARGVAK